MPSEIFYYRNPEGDSVVQEFLDRLGPKELARTLAQIDLLEGDSLPEEMDRTARITKGKPESADGGGGEVPVPIRVLNARSGRAHYRFAYIRKGDQTILVTAMHGKGGKASRKKQKDAVEEIESSKSLPAAQIKSHREYVAEMTLSDPNLAALYSRAREQSQFAVALIRLRDAAGFTADSLAERTGLSRARVESLERGRMPKLSTMRRLVDALQARIVIAPGTGVSIEPYAPIEAPKRPSRTRKSAEASTQPQSEV